MKNYRIKKVTDDMNTRYHPQIKILWWWCDLFSLIEYYDGCRSLEEAQEALCSHIKKSVVEYIDFDPERDCK